LKGFDLGFYGLFVFAILPVLFSLFLRIRNDSQVILW
jgi:hypothetical protein